LPKKSSEVAKIESKFKLSLLQAEKRLVDLEVAVSELNEKLKDVDLKELVDLKTRVEDLEDLIMVEQAGIVELKKLLEDVVSRPTPSIPEDLEEKLKSLEEKISSTLESISKIEGDMNKIKEKITTLEKKPPLQPFIEEIKKIENNFLITSAKVGAVESNITSLKGEINKKISEVEKKIETLKKKPLPEPFLDEFKRLENSFLMIDTRISSLEKMIKDLSQEMSKVRPISEEIKKIENNFLITSAKVDSIEKFVKDFTAEVNKIKPELEKVSEGLKSKIEEAKMIEKKLESFYSEVREKVGIIDRAENIVKSWEGILENFSMFEGRISAIQKYIDENLTRIKNEIEKLSEKIEGVLTIKQTISELALKEIEKRFSGLEERNRKKLEEIASIVERRVIENRATIGGINAQIDELINRVIDLESKIAAMEKIIQETSKPGPVILE
jgi:chromosome segregation ATPase